MMTIPTNSTPETPHLIHASADHRFSARDNGSMFPPDRNGQNSQVPFADSGSRIISLCEPVGPETAIRMLRELLCYEAADPGIPIHLQIFTPGGCVVSGLAIVDAMQHISSPVFTYAIGFAASMGAVILACGEKDHRYILPHSRVMIHQASGSAGGPMDNLRATLAFQTSLEQDNDQLLSTATGRSVVEIQSASRIDNWMSAKAAVEFGLVDHILEAALSPAHQ